MALFTGSDTDADPGAWTAGGIDTAGVWIEECAVTRGSDSVTVRRRVQIGDDDGWVTQDLNGSDWSLASDTNSIIDSQTSTTVVFADATIPSDSVLSNHARYDGPAIADGVTAEIMFDWDNETANVLRAGLGPGIGGDDWHFGWGPYRPGGGTSYTHVSYGDIDTSPTMEISGVSDDAMARVVVSLAISADGTVAKSFDAGFYDASGNLIRTRSFAFAHTTIDLGASIKFRVWGYGPTGAPGATRDVDYTLKCRVRPI